MHCLELNPIPQENPRNYAAAVIARRHRVSIPVAKLIADLVGLQPLVDDWQPLAAPTNAILARLTLSNCDGERA